MSCVELEPALNDGPTLAALCDLAEQAALAGDRRMRESIFAQRIAEVARERGPETRADLLRNVLGRMVAQNAEKIDALNYPRNLRALVHAEFQRIADSLKDATPQSLDLEHYAMRADLRIACFSRIPAGVSHLESCTIPRSLAYRGGIRQAARFLKMLGRTGGVGPFYGSHVATDIAAHPMAFLRRYTPATRKEVYRNVAACLEMNPSHRGLVSASWWFDPEVTDTNRVLAKLGETMLQNGAFLFRYKSDADAMHNALVNSPARQKLYDQGKYTPTTYFVVWPRDALLAWAKTGG